MMKKIESSGVPNIELDLESVKQKTKKQWNQIFDRKYRDANSVGMAVPSFSYACTR